MDVLEAIGIALTAAGLLGGLTAWAIRATVAPIKVAIENNTIVMTRVIDKLDEHDVKLDDHGNRITKIETKHSMRYPDEP